MFTGDRIIVGKCSLCGGVVSLPRAYMSVNRPAPRCESCGAIADEAKNLRTVPMIPRPKQFEKSN